MNMKKFIFIAAYAPAVIAPFVSKSVGKHIINYIDEQKDDSKILLNNAFNKIRMVPNYSFYKVMDHCENSINEYDNADYREGFNYLQDLDNKPNNEYYEYAKSIIKATDRKNMRSKILSVLNSDNYISMTIIYGFMWPITFSYIAYKIW